MMITVEVVFDDTCNSMIEGTRPCEVQIEIARRLQRISSLVSCFGVVTPVA